MVARNETTQVSMSGAFSCAFLARMDVPLRFGAWVYRRLHWEACARRSGDQPLVPWVCHLMCLSCETSASQRGWRRTVYDFAGMQSVHMIKG